MPSHTGKAGGLVSKAMEAARARRLWQRESRRYHADVTPDGKGMGMGIENLPLHGAHLGSLGSIDIVTEVQKGSPAHTRGLRLLDRVVEIEVTSTVPTQP